MATTYNITFGDVYRCCDNFNIEDVMLPWVNEFRKSTKPVTVVALHADGSLLHKFVTSGKGFIRYVWRDASMRWVNHYNKRHHLDTSLPRNLQGRERRKRLANIRFSNIVASIDREFVIDGNINVCSHVIPRLTGDRRSHVWDVELRNGDIYCLSDIVWDDMPKLDAQENAVW